jgi:hypothetical protein
MRRLALCCWLLGAVDHLAAQSVFPSEHVVIVTFDGVRWQELLAGASRELITGKAGGVADTQAVLRRFWRTTPAERREALFPFLWSMVAREGLLLGDSASGHGVRVTNGKRFSYPGYNELLSGAPDPRIASNEKIPNPNVTVLEWLNRQPGFQGRVAAFGSWDVLPSIVHAARSGVYTNGDGPPVREPRSEADRALNQLAAGLPPYWGTVRFDGVTMEGAIRHLKVERPRVLYVMLGDTDEWAHERRYDLYLDAAQRSDRFLRRLWDTLQAIPRYRGKTALLVATDHGRGAGDNWTDHGRDVPEADRIWVGILPASGRGGPRTIPPGSFTQSQVAATIAGLLGLEREFRAAQARAAPSLPLP